MQAKEQTSMDSLAARRFTEYPVTSLFLDLRPIRIRRPGLVFLKKELSRLEKSVPAGSAEAELLLEDIGRLQESVAEAQREKASHLAVFSSAKEGLLEKFFWSLAPESDRRIPNSLVRGFRPHLFPFALLSDRLESFLLLVADLRKGELFRVEAGRISERWKKSAEQISETRREKRGAYDRRVGFAHTTFTKHVEGRARELEERFFRALAEKTAAWAKTAGIRTVLLGADAVSGPPIKEELARLNPRLAIELAPIEAKLPEVKKLALGIQAFRKKEEAISQQRVEELFSSGKHQAFFGATEVLNFLRESKRGTVLVLDEAFHKEAPLCGLCSALVPDRPSCPVCSGPVFPAAVENELVCLAAAAGVKVEFVEESGSLAAKGGVGLLV